MNSLAVIILTKNEEVNIVDAIEAAKACATEVLVVDSGSTDGTVELAKAHGARVVFRAWTNDFAAQRNFALTQTESDWVFYVDADERITPDLAQAVEQVIAANEAKQYSVTRKSVAFGTKFNHGVLKPDHVARLFPRTAVTWVNPVHEHPECDLPLVQLPGYLEHYTYRSWAQWEGKVMQYTSIWAEEAYERGRRISLSGVFLHSLGGFFKMFFGRLGFLDGWMGVFMCCHHFFYETMKYLKLHEQQRMKQK